MKTGTTVPSVYAAKFHGFVCTVKPLLKDHPDETTSLIV